MKIIDHKDRFEHVREDVPTRIFICANNAIPDTYVKRVVRDCLNPDLALERAILVFERGISKRKVTRMIKQITEAIEKETARDGVRDLHIDAHSNVREKRIKQILRQFETEFVVETARLSNN